MSRRNSYGRNSFDKASGAVTPLDNDEDEDSLEVRRISAAQLLEGIEEQLEAIARSQRFLIMPDTPMMQRWDLVILTCLLFTATVTPYEVAFTETSINAMFLINRLVDLLFLCDMLKEFKLMYWANGRLIRNRRMIVERYLKSWFLIDVITILPYDSAKFLFSDDIGALRMVRLFRLAKLLRILRASRIFNRWETKLGLQHTSIMTVKLIISLSAACHWLACFWGMLAFMQDQNKITWMSNWLESQASTDEECKNANHMLLNGAFRSECYYHLDAYTASLHWSIMTITSIGYGDIVPSNPIEYAWCSMFMLLAGVSWAMIIGEICGIAAAGDPVDREFHQVNDDMNRVMDTMNLPMAHRQRVRMFMKHSKTAMADRTTKTVLSNLPPSLASFMAGQKTFIREDMVMWMRSSSSGLKASIMCAMETFSYPPEELILPGSGDNPTMFVLKSGTICVATEKRIQCADVNCNPDNTCRKCIIKRKKKGTIGGVVSRMVMAGSESTIWNEDMVIALPSMRHNSTARTITYTEVEHLHKSSLEKVLVRFRDEKKEVRRMTLWLALQRGMVFMNSHGGMMPYQWEEHVRTARSVPVAQPVTETSDVKAASFGTAGMASGAVSESLAIVLGSIQQQLATLQADVSSIKTAINLNGLPERPASLSATHRSRSPFSDARPLQNETPNTT